jgi:uncharacterized Zn-binding protein involved in type VI secretion
MSEIIIKTQKEFDALPVECKEYTYIKIDSHKNIEITVDREIKNATVRADGSSTVRAGGSSTVRADGSSTVRAGGSSTVVADGSSTVVADGSSTVRAYGSACVHCMSLDVNISLFSFAVCFLIKNAKVTKKSKTSTIIKPKSKNPTQEWLDKEGVEGKDKVILYKKVSCDLKTQENSSNETFWAIGSTLDHPNYDPSKEECGEGKYHACAKTFFCDDFRNVIGDRYIAIEINKKDLFVWAVAPQYPHKVAFKKGKVLYEVDKHGKKI